MRKVAHCGVVPLGVQCVQRERVLVSIALATGPRGEPASDLAALVRAAQAGDRGALSAVFDRHQRDVLGFCLLAADRDRDRALDLLQETFTRAFEYLAQLQDPKRFRSWLFAIAANICRTRATQEGRLRRTLEAASLEQEAEAPVNDPAEREG